MKKTAQPSGAGRPDSLRPYVVGVWWLLTAACHSQIPYDFSKVERMTVPHHPLSIAILTFRDVRARDEEADASHFVYQGREYRATELAQLAGNPCDRVTEIVAQHLHREGLFERIVLVENLEQAKDVDLLLEGSVFRMRGYVEEDNDQREQRAEGDTVPERHVMSEVLLRNVRVRPNREGAQFLVDSDVGWAIFEPRDESSDQPLDPWSVLGEALFASVSRMAGLLREADLSGGFRVVDRVHLNEVAIAQMRAKTANSETQLAPHAGADLAALADAAPEGWTYTSTSTLSSPIGWKTPATCQKAAFIQRQTLKYHRVLGPYRPAVMLWSCPVNQAFRYDAKEEFAARFLGETATRRFFARALGETNWPTALDEITAGLEIEPPASRYVFELPPRL